MTEAVDCLRFFLDEGVPDAVARTARAFGHEVIRLRDALPAGAPDTVICIAAEANGSVLVAFDKDMKTLAKGHGVTKARFKELSILRFSCTEVRAAQRIKDAMSLIEHEWQVGHTLKLQRRLYIEIGESVIRTHR